MLLIQLYYLLLAHATFSFPNGYMQFMFAQQNASSVVYSPVKVTLPPSAMLN